MIQIFYKGKPSNYPLYESEEEAREAMMANGVDEEDFLEDWPSPRGVELQIQFVEIQE